VLAQDSNTAASTSGERRTVGTVSSIGRGSIVVQTDEGQFVVYTMDSQTYRPQLIEPGARVSVVTMSDDTEAAPKALAIEILPPRQGLATPAADPIPQNVRQLEAQIERQARRYRAGLKGGAALDPEMITFDGFATFGPIFKDNLDFRPSVEFGFGEVTTLVAMHFDLLFRMPGIARSIRWAPYFGGGPTAEFSHRGFSGDVEDEDIDDDGDDDSGRFDFGDFVADSGLNFIVGVRNPNGVFFELKATAYGVAHVRMVAGFEF
jgi:hypothetical protein